MKFYDYINEQKKLEIPDFLKNNREFQASLDLMKEIESYGYSVLIVGGFVRDVILGIPSKDIDLCTNMPQDEIEKKFNTYDIGKNKQFGVSVVKYKEYDFEIAQYRKDIYQSLEGSKGADEVELVSDFKEDSARRDFTLNSLGLSSDLYIIDHNNGTSDIENKVVAAVGDARMRFKEDAVRMMRGVRSAAKLDFDVEQNTKETMKQMATDIKNIAPERVKDELVKMASQTGSKFARAITLLDETGILEIILPEITKLKEFKEQPEHHPEAYEEGEGRVFDHVLAALKKNKAADPLINLSILLHDVSKGLGYKGGEYRFFGHAENSKDLIDTIADRLKLTNKERKSILFTALNHMKIHNALDMKPTKILRLVDDEHWGVLKAVSYCDDACRKHLFDKKKFDKIINNMEKIQKKWGDKATNKTAKIVDGERVMKLTGLRPGPEVGQIIKKVTDWVVNNGSKEPIDKLIKRAYKDIK